MNLIQQEQTERTEAEKRTLGFLRSLLFSFFLLQTACSAVAQIRSVSADTNGQVVAPLNFWPSNSAALSDAIGVGRGIVKSGGQIHFGQSAAYFANRIPFSTGTNTIGFDIGLQWNNSTKSLDLHSGGFGTTISLEAATGNATFSGIGLITAVGGAFSSSLTRNGYNVSSASINGTNTPILNFQDTSEIAFGLSGTNASANVMALSASKVTSGTMATARLGSGTANSTTFLSGDQTYKQVADAQVASGAAIGWSKIDKTGSSLADLATRSASDLSSGTVATARLGSGTANSTTFLRGDQSYAQVADAQVSSSAAIGWSKIDKTGSSLADLATRSASDLTSGTVSSNRLPTLVKDLSNITGVAGDLFWYDGTNFTRLPKGPEGFIMVISNGVPTWTTNIDQATITNINTTVINATTVKVAGKNVPALHINATNTAPEANIQDTATLKWAFNGTSNWTANVQALTGDVTTSGTAATIANDAVTYAKMQNISATARAIGRNTAGSGDPEEVTGTQILDWIGSTRGSILYRGASGWAALTPGTSGYVLTSGGSGADPSYAAAAGGGTSVYQNGTSVSNPNFKDTADIVWAIGASTNMQANHSTLSWNTVTYSGTNLTAMDLSLGDTRDAWFKLSLTNTAQMPAPSNIPAYPKKVHLEVQQDSTGTWALTFTNAAFSWAGGDMPIADTNANAVSYFEFITSAFTNSLVHGTMAGNLHK